MLIDANHLKLTLGGRSILSDVSLHLEAGQIYGLLGPNGAGKSTTIAILLGLYPSESGTLALFDKPIDKGSTVDTRGLRQRIGVMPEHAGFYDWMTASCYLTWYAGFYGGMQQPLPELLERVDLDDARNRPIGQFSRGMQQRLGLARALLHGPELLILDEPTNGLDPRGRREIHDLLLELAQQRQVGILLCTHLLDDVDRLCTNIGIIDQGRSVLEGPLIELLGQQQVGRRFRLRMETLPKNQTDLPSGVSLLGQEGGWWHFIVHADNKSSLAAVWEALLKHDWRYSEIHAEGGGLEELYLRLTSAARPVREAA